MFLGIHRLAEDRLFPTFLLTHCTRCLFKVIEGLRTHRRRVGDYRLRFRIDLDQRSAVRTTNLKWLDFRLRHVRIIAQSQLACIPASVLNLINSSEGILFFVAAKQPIRSFHAMGAIGSKSPVCAVMQKNDMSLLAIPFDSLTSMPFYGVGRSFPPIEAGHIPHYWLEI